MSTVSTIYQKYVFGLSILPRQGQDLLLEIHNHSRHTFRQYSKKDKNIKTGLKFRNSS